VNAKETWDTFNAWLLTAVEAAAFVGVRWAVVHPHTFTVQTGYEEQIERRNTLEHLLPVVRRAKEVGLGLCVENMRGPHRDSIAQRYCAMPESLCELVDTLAYETGADIGVCWDTGHANIAGHKQSEALMAVGKRLKMLLTGIFSGEIR
jgi:sugar phosphate isomerase/epimerase